MYPVVCTCGSWLCLLYTHPGFWCGVMCSDSLVDIPGCVAAQVLGEETTVLSEGTLSLVVMPKSDKEAEPVLTLVVGKSAFPLYKSTVFGTLANDSRTYVFTPEVEGANKG